MDLSGCNVLTTKSSSIGKPAPMPSASGSISVNSTLLMQSGSGTGVFRGQPAIITGKMLVTGRNVWSLN
jgi:hypothetical protein